MLHSFDLRNDDVLGSAGALPGSLAGLLQSSHKFGTKINIPIDDFNHLMDAMRYALEDMLVGSAFSFE